MFYKKVGIESRNIILMYIFNIVGGLLFFLPVLALYLEKNLFTVTNVAIIFSIEAILWAVFEIPTGAIADIFGRKKTLIIGHMLALLSFVFLYIGGSMLVFILFAVLNSLGRSLGSGTESALIYDTLKSENKEEYYKKIIGTYHALWPFGAVVGSLVGGYIATFSLSLTVLLTFIPMVLATIVIFFLEEPEYEKEEERNILKHMINSSKIVIQDYQLIILFIGGFIIWGLGESMHGLNSLFFTFKDIPLIYFGAISSFIFGLSSLGHYTAHDVSEKIGDKKTLIVSTLGTAAFLLTATLTESYLTAVLWIIPSYFFGLRNPVIDHRINLEVPSSRRATIISVYNLFIRVGVAILAPFIGYLAELYNINTAFKISAGLMFTVPVLYLFLKNNK
ncbi:MFS transporter [Candidatus Woesearchaeota archaeon]|nr:MFS transporter [Candidatus Woesearchaeota archaeon]